MISLARHFTAIAVEALDELWFSMHGSDDQTRRVVAATCYLDDSADDGRTALLGGCVLTKDEFVRLDERWRKMLLPYGLEYLHMVDFVRPYGQYSGMYDELKLNLFGKAVSIIRSLSQYTISVSVPVDICSQLFSKEFQREILSPYAVAFIAISQLNIKLANQHGVPDRLAYLMDTGNPYASQLQLGHAFQSYIERLVGSSFTGRLTFENDASNTALQASDMISWSARRYWTDGLVKEFAPLAGIFTQRYTADNLAISPHYFYSIKAESLDKLRDMVETRGATLPKLQELLSAAKRSTVQ